LLIKSTKVILMGSDSTTELGAGTGVEPVQPLDARGVQPLGAPTAEPATQPQGERPTTVPSSHGEVGNIPITRDRTPRMPQRTPEQMANWPLSDVDKQGDHIITGGYEPIIDPETNRPYLQDLTIKSPLAPTSEQPLVAAQPTQQIAPSETAEVPTANPLAPPTEAVVPTPRTPIWKRAGQFISNFRNRNH